MPHSLGINSSISNKVKNHLKSGRSFAYNSTQLQSDKSVLCGEFTIFYIVRHFYDDDISFSEFMNHYFSSNQKRNEQRVVKFIQDINNGKGF